ncbi:hypothetical protein MCOR27_003930 [Pyricularia oryzae]|uniref:Fumarate reductase n=2 Tax=Pyricularia TaxID=48558 RepID=A0ABQ8NEC2_PYRGI|nr:hypothetical protein MCOR01_005961 [Pyricularia oryzae]KAI6295679.1 hypothetical protein MCOR33_007474 [Pyricularia grisea]KAH9435202.1 hypothetical protein MCOR02_004154 [Pyricularia oryzae]KAI6258772.1 hypothetical protein MCOR19_004871 [Pyricularia oryzae]KAI6282007.1 hypothetical protein MCOR27_003930 [Pyricularia oryzae]
MPTGRLTAKALATFLAILIPLVAVYYTYRDTYIKEVMAAVKVQPAQQIIIVGAGLAGLSAAHAALTASPSASVLLLERAAKPGGNSIKASSGINGAPTRFQTQSWDSAALFRDDTLKSAGARLNSAGLLDRHGRQSLIGNLTERSAAAVHFLHDDVGVDLSVVTQLGGHSVPRTHRGAGKTPPGFAIVSALLAKLKDEVGKDGRFELRTDCEVTKLLTKPGENDQVAVVGVEYTSGAPAQDSDRTTASALGPVIFAAGGFAGDATGLLIKHRPDLGPLPSTNDARPATALNILEADAKAILVDMDSIQVHPTGFVDPANPNAPVKILAAEMLRGEGGILLRHGKRFVNEMDTREHVSSFIMAQPPSDEKAVPKQWEVTLLLDPGSCEAASGHLGFYVFKGLMAKKKISDLDVTTRQTLREYSDIAAGEKPDPFGRRAFGHWSLKGGDVDSEKEVCIGQVTPITHFTMGGAAINDKAQILSSTAQGRPIEGLWAAGEITGGVHGDNRLGGSSLLECVVYGRIAGEEAARYVSSRREI